MPDERVVELTMSEWESPVAFASKTNKKRPFCVDYRVLNAMTARDTYPLPQMDETSDLLRDSNIFSKIDCNSRYWQIETPEADRNKTTFSSDHGLFRLI